MASYQGDKQEILTRLRRMEGQLRGIQRMVENDKYCIDVLTQISSIIAAAQRVGAIVLKDHINGCVRKALTDGQSSDDAVNELVEAVSHFTRA
ncbi:MAG: metal-sensitive transcriptional regulator [Chloroflexi bacterium]|nr:metal-sensitive transcriptional regulator [Chloroflexota bacterium]